MAPRLGLTVNQEAVNSVTRGLVGDSSFAVLPDIVPLTCFLLTLGTQIVSQSLLFSRRILITHSRFSCAYCTSPRGKRSLVRSLFVATPPFCSAGTSTRKLSCSSSFHLAWLHSVTAGTLVLSDRWQYPVTSRYSRSCSQPPSFPSRQFTPSSGSCCFC